MTAPDPAWVEAGAKALVGGTNYHMTGDNGHAGTMNRLTAEFVIRAVEPLIREQIADDIEALAGTSVDLRGFGWHDGVRDAAAIARGGAR